MLVLSRKANQRLVLSKHIEVIVLRIRGNRVTLGFQAPHGVTIRRAEIQQRLAMKDNDAFNCGPAARIVKPNKSDNSEEQTGEKPCLDE